MKRPENRKKCFAKMFWNLRKCFVQMWARPVTLGVAPLSYNCVIDNLRCWQNCDIDKVVFDASVLCWWNKCCILCCLDAILDQGTEFAYVWAILFDCVLSSMP